MTRKAPIPHASGAGDLMVSAGRKSSQLVLDVFDMIGGVEAMAEWAEENPGEFYTKLFTKTIRQEADVRHTVGIEDMLDDLDDLDDDAAVLDGDYEDVTDYGES